MRLCSTTIPIHIKSSNDTSKNGAFRKDPAAADALRIGEPVGAPGRANRPVVPAASFAGAVAMLVGGLVFIGWALDIAALKSVLPGWVSMKPNAAFAFTLSGIAVRLSSLPFFSPNSDMPRVGSGPTKPDGGRP